MRRSSSASAPNIAISTSSSSLAARPSALLAHVLRRRRLVAGALGAGASSETARSTVGSTGSGVTP